MYLIRSRARADLPKSPQTVVALAPNVRSVVKQLGAVAAKQFSVRNAAVARHQEMLDDNPRNPVVQHQFASGGTDGWFGGADSDCRPSSAISRGERAGGQFPAPRTV